VHTLLAALANRMNRHDDARRIRPTTLILNERLPLGHPKPFIRVRGKGILRS
jgi:hypothetical protein